ncbi:MAG: cystathionine gamma-synthase family protein [Nitrososphaeria archaeon]|nr:cystathionine gamma-synthase family protein [Nitrososphaeria archaeon]
MVNLTSKKNINDRETNSTKQLKGFSTKSIHGHEFYDPELGLFKVPIYQTVVWEQFDKITGLPRKTSRETELKYSREENPTVYALEKVLAKLDDTEDALAFNCGMAAISTIYLSTLESGSTILISKEAYGVTQQLALNLGKYGVKTLFGGPNTEEIIDLIDDKVSLVVVETITNPLLKVIDVNEVIKVCKENNVKIVVDNTFATPILYRPVKNGAWLVLYSLTKYLSGHNDVIGGSVAGDKETIKVLWDWRKNLGTIMNPFEAYLVIRGLETLEVRFIKQCENALEIAEFLKDNPNVEEVYYPGLKDNAYHSIANKVFEHQLYGGVVSFKVKGGKESAFNFFKKIKVIKSTPSLGGVETLATYPILSASKSMPQSLKEELGITDNLIRLSVGLEDIEDLKEDIEQALKS